ncbi:MAG: hypothetical protein AAFW60_00490 [Pseudomonadota bacterium]
MTPDKDIQEMTETVRSMRREVEKQTRMVEEFNRDRQPGRFGLPRGLHLKTLVGAAVLIALIKWILGV